MKHRGQLEQRLLVLVTLGLVAFGLVMVYSATSAAAAINEGDPMTYLKRHAIYAVLGIGLMIVASRVDNRKLRLLAPPLVAASIGLCVVVLAIAPEVNGAKRWLYLGPVSFQPSEVAKLALLLFAAAWLARNGAPRTLGELWRPLGLLAAVFAGLFLLQPDLGTTIALMLMLSGMLLVAGVPARTLAAGAGLAGTLGLAAIWVSPYRRERIFSFLDPWRDPTDTGFQTVQATIGLGSGGLTGEGLGESVQKINYLPEAHTDMILAIIGEELGLVGIFSVVALYGLIAYAGFRAAKHARDRYAKLLATGITALILCQATLNMFAVMGLAPLTGIPLPLISYGNSNLIVVMAAMGLLLNVAATGGAATRTRKLTAIDGGRADDARRNRSRRDSRSRRSGTGSRRRATG
jgi:cell division protein FtsW